MKTESLDVNPKKAPATLREVFDNWRQNDPSIKDRGYWEGTAYELHKALLPDLQAASIFLTTNDIWRFSVGLSLPYRSLPDGRSCLRVDREPATPAPPQPQPQPLDFASLRAATTKRQAFWCPDNKPDLSFRGLELAGEVGEACNLMKKLGRERHGWPGSRACRADLAEELADVIICVDLVAEKLGIDLSEAVRKKFNKTSEAVGLPVSL